MDALVLLSGGIDSAVALYWARAQGWTVTTIEFDYYLRPERERESCRRLRACACVEGITVPVGFLRETGDLEPPVNEALGRAPEGYLPVRNLIFYSICAYYAEIRGAGAIVGGHNRTDPESFPDAGREFFARLEGLLDRAMWSHASTGTRIVLPLIDLDKAGVIELGRRLGVPFDLTWSCYYDGERPCGVCISCIERESVVGSG
jgi:7-cyano-7-deazaguanine synthase